MDVSIEDFRRHFALLSDGALLETRREDLVESAQQCLDEELSRRGLTRGAAGETPSEKPAEEPAPSGGEPVLIATYTVAEEASLARGLLRSASIPCHIANEYTGLGSFQLQLLVPAAYVEHALDVLAADISDDELAAQAEAAGAFAEEREENEADEESPA
ncbi:MAG: hypothetical protein ABSB15_15925 [Bryobacteraceae bacterium]|jgi:hypothetical protein